MTRMIAGLKESRSSSRGVNLGYSDRIELVLVGSRNPRALYHGLERPHCTEAETWRWQSEGLLVFD